MPRKPAPKKRPDDRVRVHLPKDLWDQVVARAEAERRSATGQLDVLVRRGLRASPEGDRTGEEMP